MTGKSSLHVYPRRALLPDYARALAGLAVTGLPLLFTEPASVMFWLLLGFAALFAIYGLRTMLRQRTRIELDDEGIGASGAWGGRVDWKDLRDVSVRYYSTRRDRSGGWMQLVVRGRGRSVSADSTISGFERLVADAVAAAARRGVSLSQRTRANVGALGIALPPAARE
jgi:hypothetical protein